MPKKAKLTDQQRRFVEEYMKDLNAAQAAARAGYKSKAHDQVGFRLRSNPIVSAEIDAQLKAKSERAKIDADWFVKRLVKIIDFDPSEVIDDENNALKPGVSLVNVDSLNISKSEGPGGISRGMGLKKTDRLKAMELLLKLTGILDGNGSGSDQGSAEALKARALGALTRSSGQSTE